MAIFSKALLASSLLASLALAAPLNNNKQARDVITDIVTETVWTTLDVTTTIYDDEPPATSAAVMPTSSAAAMTWASPTAAIASSSAAALAAPSAAAPSPSSSAAEFFTTMASISPSSSGIAAQAATPTSTSPIIASSSAAAMASSAAPAPSSGSSSSTGSVPAGSTDGTCEGESAPCVGDVTYWTGGLGACGSVVDTTSELAIALPYAFMGTLSNTNPYCGRSVTLYNPTSGTTVQATVMDKCMGCVDRAIDCTELLFNQITDNMGNGRMSGIEWWLN